MDIKLKKSKKEKKSSESIDKKLDIQEPENEQSEDNNLENDEDYNDTNYDNDIEDNDVHDDNDIEDNDVHDDNDIEDKKNIKVLPKNDVPALNSSSYLKNLLVAFIVLILAFVTFCGYGKIKQVVKHSNTEIYSRYVGNSNIVNEYTDVLYKKYCISSNPNIKNYEDIFVDKYSDNQEFNESAKSKLKDNLDNWENSISRDYKNIDYAVIDSSGKVMSNTDDYMYDSYKSSDIEDISDTYDWYEVIEFDNMGEAKVEHTNGNDNWFFNSYFALKDAINTDYSKYYNKTSGANNDDSNLDQNKITVKPIKNLTFIYGIRKNLDYKDQISKLVTEEQYSIGGGNNENVINIIIGIILIAIIISVLIPYKYAVKVIQGKILFRIPFEINIIIDAVISVIICMVFFMSMMVSINGDAYRYLFNNYNIEPRTAFITIGIINIGFLFFVYNFIFAGVTYIKYILHTGVIKYYKQNSIIPIMFRGLRSAIKKIIDGSLDIDFNSRLDISILKIVVINFVVLVGMLVICHFGVIAIFIYSVVLFILIRNYMVDIKNKYTVLLKATNHIAEGNLNIRINEDLGLFNPLKDKLKRIQGGIKKAVSKEVHSERMKTELITNVSHDLKTPLTSIITYTDLLKHGNPTEEERQKYIDTIDRKSKRLKALIEDLFDVSKATSGDIKLNKMDIDIIGLIKQTEIEYEDNLRAANLTVRNNFPKGKVILNVDGEKTYRIFANLLGNAVKYSIPGSRVYLDINNYFDKIEIVMKNTSVSEMNFSENEITERFVRGDKSRNTEGSGLGLAIVKSFIEIQNGKLIIKMDGDLFKAIVVFKK